MPVLLIIAIAIIALIVMVNVGAVPVAFTVVEDIPLSSSITDIAANIPGSKLAEESLIVIALNGETTDIRAQVSVGGNQVLPESPVSVQATSGVLPVTPDDNIITTFGKAGEDIVIRGTNLDAAAARELRAKVQVFPVKDLQLIAQALREGGIPASA